MTAFLLILTGTGTGTCSAAGPANEPTSGGIPGILKYAQQYREEEKTAAEPEKTGKKGKATGAVSSGQGLSGSTELRRRLTLREQELRQLKKENQVLQARQKGGPDTAPKSAESDRQMTSLKAELAESRKQQDTLTRQAVQAQEALNARVLDLEQQVARTDTECKAGAAQAGKEKADLLSSLTALKAELADMPVVTPETLKPEGVQQIYAAGVMLGRDMLNLQVAQQKLGLKTDNRILVAGIRDALNRKVLLNEPTLEKALREAESVAQKARQAVIREQKKAGSLYLEKFRKHKDVKQAESGFWYRTEYAGDGGFIRGDDTIVDVVVTEKLTDGTVVEDMDARGQVISQPLGDYPALFRSALVLMKNHGTVELVVPSDLAYGDGGYPPKVPPGATMVYTLRVEEVKPAAENPGAEDVSKKEAESAGAGNGDRTGRTEGVKK
ncbi:FKBP-type peptidyl-prolyl cis-trans isomerase [Salmonella enterica]|nr:peptidylprolyl isomerase [Salmonella enterica]EIG1170464.1 FKBP-type peptidyl-prolyl cis-trans isomerase [Salmonella enterica subsp. diarizonae serovar 48:k:z53]HAU3321036.1 peptidylprolyl isomerase [Salmonella enterica subsp. diarizonae]EIF5383980.1 FKBP-type peptidyl-prolyl cis-trans isomerase [Salmonella enterica]EIF7272459.1 FKBP-type peptidyl-prolyl cis-trans isomerase [Salmonella enterica]